MKHRIYFKCPYCNHKNSMEVESTMIMKGTVWTCDDEEGGCERDFVIYYKFEPEVIESKIEGE